MAIMRFPHFAHKIPLKQNVGISLEKGEGEGLAFGGNEYLTLKQYLPGFLLGDIFQQLPARLLSYDRLLRTGEGQSPIDERMSFSH